MGLLPRDVERVLCICARPTCKRLGLHSGTPVHHLRRRCRYAVRDYDPEAELVTVIADDGRPHAYDAARFRAVPSP